MPAAVVVPALRPLALVLGSGLHVGITLLHGYVFVFNPACYALAFYPLLPPFSDLWTLGAFLPTLAGLVNFPTALTVGLLGIATVKNMEDWPLNHMGLYSYNYEQVAFITARWDMYLLHPASSAERARRDATLNSDTAICVAKYGVGNRAFRGIADVLAVRWLQRRIARFESEEIDS